ncbi:hypothetical protein ACFCXL_07475 [[Kitasatospora] papulosa]|uniref:hypothetical protein n=1 Tax=[Kitasatospora] papulosa TaxID=1464011 RepID=UPI0035E23752
MEFSALDTSCMAMSFFAGSSRPVAAASRCAADDVGTPGWAVAGIAVKVSPRASTASPAVRVSRVVRREVLVWG